MAANVGGAGFTMHQNVELQCLLGKLDKSVYKMTPVNSLRSGQWVKLICGASFEDVTEVRNLSLAYALAGVDCIDCAADEAVVRAVIEGIDVAKYVALHLGYGIRDPWVMVSINDDEDPHFRKAEFNTELCPVDCPRPCERICPATAISSGGVLAERCYGCGRCIPVCPVQNIEAKTYVRNLDAVSKLLSSSYVDAVEIHTGEGHLEAFHRLITNLASVLKDLNLVAVSIPDFGDSVIPTMVSMYEYMRKNNITCHNLWQLDGRPMSGDIGKGATRATVAFASRITSNMNRPPGFLQLAGGTNSYTLQALEAANCNIGGDKSSIAGIAFGGYARKIVSKVLKKMECSKLESNPQLLVEAVYEAAQLVMPVKHGKLT